MPLQDQWGEPQGAIAIPEFDSAMNGVRVDIQVAVQPGDDTTYKIKVWEASSPTKYSSNWQPTTAPDSTDTFKGSDGFNQQHNVVAALVNDNYYVFRMVLQKQNAQGKWIDDTKQPDLALYQYSSSNHSFTPVQPTQYVGG